MYGELSLQQMQMAGPVTAESLRREAAQQFWRLRLTGNWGRTWARLTGRTAQPADLNEDAAQVRVTGRRDVGLRSVSLEEIVGSEGRSQDFDAQFRPVAGHIRDRWVGIATAMRRGVALPPVSLVQLGERYYVRDGNHRVSVARFLGQSQIDAEVTLWQTA